MTTNNGNSPPAIVAITLGDPAGIGPEVVVKALAANDDLRLGLCRPLIVGSYAVAEMSAQRFAGGLPLSHVDSREQLADVDWNGQKIPVWNIDTPGASEIPFGVPTIAGGVVSITSIELAATLALESRIQAISTAPINKEAVHMAGYKEIGHQEVLARMAGITEIATMLMAHRLRAVHLTTHVPFRDAYKYVAKDRILARLRLTDHEFRKWGVAEPRIAVSALNPHGGDAGLLGREEIEEIAPAVEQAVSEGILAEGPLPADSVFLSAAAGNYDAVIALYHDQGHIAVKMHDFHGSVSVNLGLPFVRTSVDHGTAYDIAGTGAAEAVSMSAAIRTAALLATGRGLDNANIEQETRQAPARVYG
ncbi:MAG: 4-hydroxythreonine-4-phosphate dehydrogenase PdxA [Dehalococcoidia bacterium]|nr:4-hydroxythreonine-4-phosphate dehydrogenase PdxA [Dehalococcoidia bacterium]